MAGDLDLDHEAPLVLGSSLFDHAVHRQLVDLGLRPLLKLALRGLARSGRRGLDLVVQRAEDPVARHLESRLEVDGADDGLEEARAETGPRPAAGRLLAHAEPDP